MGAIGSPVWGKLTPDDIWEMTRRANRRGVESRAALREAFPEATTKEIDFLCMWAA